MDRAANNGDNSAMPRPSAEHVSLCELCELIEQAEDEGQERLRDSRCRRTALYFDLASFGSISASGLTRPVPVRCRKRPARKACKGLLEVRRRDLPPAIEWRCPACGASGRIIDWEDSQADLRKLETETAATVASAGLLTATISVEAHATLREQTRGHLRWAAVVFGATVEKGIEKNAERDLAVLHLRTEDRLPFGSDILLAAMSHTGPHHIDLLAEIANAVGVHHDDTPADGVFAPGLALTDEATESLMAAFEGERATAEIVRPDPTTTPVPGWRHAPSDHTYQIKVSLRHVQPPVWRRLNVPSDIELPEFHLVLQIAMGWQNEHLHLFRVGEKIFAPDRPDTDELGQGTAGVKLRDLAPKSGCRIIYDYDFGDGWEHDIVIEKILDDPCDSPLCIKGMRACPPEDCGGPPGYEHLRASLADPADAEHEHFVDWLGDEFDPEQFDLDDLSITNEELESLWHD